MSKVGEGGDIRGEGWFETESLKEVGAFQSLRPERLLLRPCGVLVAAIVEVPLSSLPQLNLLVLSIESSGAAHDVEV